MKHPPPPPFQPPPIQLHLREREDGAVELQHNAAHPVMVTLHPPPNGAHGDHLQTILPGVYTELRFPPDDHEWIAVPTLGDPGLVELCAFCPARRITDPQPGHGPT